MISMIMSVIGLIILIPLIYFLPIGIQKNVKWIIVVFAVFLVGIGSLALNVMEIWKIALILLLLSLMFAYLLEKKLAHHVVEANDFETDEDAFTNQLLHEDERPDDTSSEELPIADYSLEKEEKTSSLIETTESMVEEVSDEKYEDEEPAEIVLSDIEKLIMEVEETDHYIEDQDTFVMEAAATVESDLEEITLDSEYEVEDSQDIIETEEIVSTNPIDIAHEIEEIDSSVSVYDEIDDNQMVEENNLLNEPLAELTDIDVELPFSEEVEEVIVDQHPSKEVTLLQKQVISSMLQELLLLKNQLGSGHYEERIIQHLDSSLPDEDYYSFAHVLIEHYISNGEFKKLEHFLLELEVRFNQYPGIMKELNYLTSLVNIKKR